MNAKTIPYNTGKVLIGCHYVDFKPHPMTKDGLLLQRAILKSKKQKPRNADRDDKIVMWGMIAVTTFVCVLGYVFDMKLGG